MAHKRPGRKAKQERKQRAEERIKIERGVAVYLPKCWDPECFCDISPGRCVAWADGRYFQTLEGFYE